MKKKSIITVFIFLPLLVVAQNYLGTFHEGNEAYNKTKYEEALRKYVEIAKQPNISNQDKADLFYNMGNAMAKMGDWEKATGAFAQSLYLKPNNPMAQYNLVYAKNKIPPQDIQKKNDDKKEKEDPKKGGQNKEQKTPLTSNLSKDQAEQILQALREEESRIQKERQGIRNGSTYNRKNW